MQLPGPTHTGIWRQTFNLIVVASQVGIRKCPITLLWFHYDVFFHRQLRIWSSRPSTRCPDTLTLRHHCLKQYNVYLHIGIFPPNVA